jgi:hypothetical protein
MYFKLFYFQVYPFYKRGRLTPNDHLLIIIQQFPYYSIIYCHKMAVLSIVLISTKIYKKSFRNNPEMVFMIYHIQIFLLAYTGYRSKIT